ncbi:reverse transcriptase domain-containing protein [Lewinella sp. JB7]|uniref:reverse transcriptase domain-containing protein n=1 Tax=Lewinella sp. JB7 TaxID=2962887 RepID=UPI0020C9E068|nr:reverse transcriptase domain-containing protein [Lewinella sp. JB7]MCP9234742.1 reverse transcriptase domain-containing protein [Lewinella sp. JB7]
MTGTDAARYFASLDAELAALQEPELQETFVAEQFPNYHHIGSYYDPREKNAQEEIVSAFEKELSGFDFTPLLAFETRQPKYAKEILHPDCNCFRRVGIKKRPIKSCSHRDRLVYACWNHYLGGHHKHWVEASGLSGVVAAYISGTGSSNVDWARFAFDYFQGRDQYSAVALDIKSFFDQLPWQLLKDNLITIVGQEGVLSEVDFQLFRKITNYTYVEREDLDKVKLKSATGMLMTRHPSNWKTLKQADLLKRNDTKKGIPQGLACSGVLANITMMEFDRKMAKLAKDSESVYLRYADDIFLGCPDLATRTRLQASVEAELEVMQLPINGDKTEYFDYFSDSQSHPVISYLGITCQGNQVSVRRNGINKFYERTSRFIYSYVNTCKKRGITPSRHKIHAIFGHTGKRNYYAYLRRASKVFEGDKKYLPKGIKGVMRKQTPWLDKQFDKALLSEPTGSARRTGPKLQLCNCPLKRD